MQRSENMGRTPKKKLLDPRRLRSCRNNSASTSVQDTGIPKSTISQNGSKDSRVKTVKTEPKYVESDKLSRFDRPATRFQSKTTPELSLHGKTKTKYVPEKQNISLKKTLKLDSKTASMPSTSRSNHDQRRNQEFFICRKRLRSEVDKDGLLDGLPTMLRYPKRTENSLVTVLNVDLNCKKSNINDGLGQNHIKYVSETSSIVSSRYRTRLHSDDSQGFLTQTQPFAIEHLNKGVNIATFEVNVSEQTNKSKSNVSQNISVGSRYRTRLHSDDSQGFVTQTQPFAIEHLKQGENIEAFEVNVSEQTNKSKSNVSQNISVGSRYRTRLHSDDSQGFLTPTQPFAIEHLNKGETIERFEVNVSEQTNTSKSNVSQNISEAREKIKGKNQRMSASTQKNLQMKSLFKELFGSESISDTSSSANESTSTKENIVVGKGPTEENSLKDETPDTLPIRDSNKVQLENISKAEMNAKLEDNSDESSSGPPSIQDCTTSSFCSSCLNDCNCKIIETSKSENSVNSNGKTLKTGNTNLLGNSSSTITSACGSSTIITPSISLDPVIAQLDADDTSDQSSVSATFSTEEETSLSSCSSTGNKMAEKQEHRGGVMGIFNPCISKSRLYGDYSALSCIPVSDYSLHQSVSIHVSSSTNDIDISPTSSVYPVNSADTTQLTSLSPQKTFLGECSTQGCLPVSVYFPKNASTLSIISSDDSTGDTMVTDNNCVNRANRTILTPYTCTDGRSFGGECSTLSLMPESVYSPRHESVLSLQSSNDSEEGFVCDPKRVNRTTSISFADGRSFVVECSTQSPWNTSNVCQQSSDDGTVLDPDTSYCNTHVDQTILTSIVDSTLLDGECSRQNCLSEPVCSPRNESNLSLQSSYDDRVCKLDNAPVDQTTFTDGKDRGIECTKHRSLSESASSKTVSNVSLQSPDDNTAYDHENNPEDQTTSIPIADGRSPNGKFSDQSCLLKSVPALSDTFNRSSDSSVSDCPSNSVDTTQYNSFEMTEKRCLDISNVISRLTSSSSDTNSSCQSDVNFLGKRAQIELFPEKVDSLPSIEDTEIDSDESNRLIIDLIDDSVNKTHSFHSPGTTNCTLTDEDLFQSRSLVECFKDKLFETESFLDYQENTIVHGDIIKEEMFVTSEKETATGDLNVLNKVCPELSSDSKLNSSNDTIALSGIKLEQQELENTKQLRSSSNSRRKKSVKIETGKNKKSSSSHSNNLKETNKSKAKSNSKSESTHQKSKKLKLNKPDQIVSKSSVKKQSTPKKKEQRNTKSKSKPETPSKRKYTKKNTANENNKDESTVRSESSQSEQHSLGEEPDKTLSNLERKKSKKETQIVSNPMPISNDNDPKQSLMDTPNRTSPLETRRKHERGHFSQLISNESLDVHAKTLWCSDNRWTVCKLLGCNDSDDIEEAMNKQWEFISPKVKQKYLSRARYALLDEDKHSMRRSRRSTEKLCKKEEEDESIVYSEALRRTAPVPVKNISDMDRFIRLKPNKQRDILKRWLKFYQKMLSRRDYSNFLIDFEQALHRSRLNDLKSSPNHRLKSNDVEMNHRRILFECMKRIKTQIITNCSEKYLNRRTELDKQYSDVVWALLNNDSSNLVPGCRSTRLEDTLNDLLELEEGGHVDVGGQAVQTESYTCILDDLNPNEQPIEDNTQTINILSDLPDVQNLELYEQILENLASHAELTSVNIDDCPEIDCDLPCRDRSPLQNGDTELNTPEPLDTLQSHELIENNIREILHQEAIDAFVRSHESSTRSCCDLDSPSCILSTWIAAEYNSLPNILASTSNNDDSL